MNRRLLFVSLLLTALLLTLHMYALAHSLYWEYRWFDIPMHILGGASIGAFVLSFGRIRRPWIYFGIMLGVTVVWEIFEYVFGISTGEPGYWVDTIKDIIDGLIGASITFFVTKK